MTGIERLRELTWNVSDIGGRTYRGGFVVTTVEDIYAIADQIERERACDADTTENVRLIVGGVIDSMERHVSGVEGAEDSPVARWARELREALKMFTHRSPVLAADGKPLREGERVWCIHGGGPYVVDDINPATGSVGATCNTHDGKIEWGFYAGELTHEDPLETPRPLTHERPVADTWERITEDIASPYCADYCIKYGVDHSGMSFEYAKAFDLVRRAKALAERDA